MRVLCIAVMTCPDGKTIDEFINRLDDIAPLIEVNQPSYEINEQCSFIKVLYLEVETLIPLYGGTGQLISIFQEECSDFGVHCLFGLASTRFSAFAAAIFPEGTSHLKADHNKRVVRVIPKGRDVKFLAPLPLSILVTEKSIVAALSDLSIKTFGDLVKADINDLVSAFGNEAALWVSTALALNELPLSHHNTPFPLTISLSFEFPFKEKSQLLFALREPLSSLVSSLQSRSQGVVSLLFRFYDEKGSISDMTLSLDFPATDISSLDHSLRCHISSFDFTSHPVAVDIKVLRSEPAFEQSELFLDKKSSFSDSVKVAKLLEKLEPLTGNKGFGWFNLIPSRIPEKMWNLLSLEKKRISSSAAQKAEKKAEKKAGWSLPPGFGASNSCVALRLLPASSRINVDVNEDQLPVFIDGTCVAKCSGPFSTLENWWDKADDASSQRFYFEALMEDGMMYWLYRKDDNWYLQGLFD